MDGANLGTEVVYKRGQDYRFVCYDRGHACQRYRVRFLCGRPGKQRLVGTEMWWRLCIVSLGGWGRCLSGSL